MGVYVLPFPIAPGAACYHNSLQLPVCNVLVFVLKGPSATNTLLLSTIVISQTNRTTGDSVEADIDRRIPVAIEHDYLLF